MSTKLKHQAGEEKAGGNVVAIGVRCCADECKKNASLLNFCPEHYEWFKFGLVTKEGKRPSDFDKKYQAFQRHKQAA